MFVLCFVYLRRRNQLRVLPNDENLEEKLFLREQVEVTVRNRDRDDSQKSSSLARLEPLRGKQREQKKRRKSPCVATAGCATDVQRVPPFGKITFDRGVIGRRREGFTTLLRTLRSTGSNSVETQDLQMRQGNWDDARSPAFLIPGVQEGSRALYRVCTPVGWLTEGLMIKSIIGTWGVASRSPRCYDTYSILSIVWCERYFKLSMMQVDTIGKTRSFHCIVW